MPVENIIFFLHIEPNYNLKTYCSQINKKTKENAPHPMNRKKTQ